MLPEYPVEAGATGGAVANYSATGEGSDAPGGGGDGSPFAIASKTGRTTNTFIVSFKALNDTPAGAAGGTPTPGGSTGPPEEATMGGKNLWQQKARQVGRRSVPGSQRAASMRGRQEGPGAASKGGSGSGSRFYQLVMNLVRQQKESQKYVLYM